MADLFGGLPDQRQPDVLVVGNHALIKCGTCGGTGEGELKLPDIVIPCRHCNGGGVRLIETQDH